tara:strand:- start:1127 stop:1546 length:420 start_codon:yes stop_codon:yes gene_type:complete
MPMPNIVTPPMSPILVSDDDESYDPYYYANLNENPFDGIDIDGMTFDEFWDLDNIPHSGPLEQPFVNPIDEFDEEFDEGYLPPSPPALIRQTEENTTTAGSIHINYFPELFELNENITNTIIPIIPMNSEIDEQYGFPQ